MRRKCLPGKETGFTLIELMAVIFLSGVIMAAIYSLFVSQNVTFSAQEQMNEMNQNLRVSMDQMTREIRSAGYSNCTFSSNDRTLLNSRFPIYFTTNLFPYDFHFWPCHKKLGNPLLPK